NREERVLDGPRRLLPDIRHVRRRPEEQDAISIDDDFFIDAGMQDHHRRFACRNRVEGRRYGRKVLPGPDVQHRVRGEAGALLGPRCEVAGRGGCGTLVVSRTIGTRVHVSVADVGARTQVLRRACDATTLETDRQIRITLFAGALSSGNRVTWEAL